jgi:hypothetical protein
MASSMALGSLLWRSGIESGKLKKMAYRLVGVIARGAFCKLARQRVMIGSGVMAARHENLALKWRSSYLAAEYVARRWRNGGISVININGGLAGVS